MRGNEDIVAKCDYAETCENADRIIPTPAHEEGGGNNTRTSVQGENWNQLGFSMEGILFGGAFSLEKCPGVSGPRSQEKPR